MAQLNVKTSVVDYLKSVGKPSDYASRSKLAEQYGIADYAGSAAQNIQLLGKMTTTNKEVIASNMGEGSTPPVINYGDSKPESANNAVSNSYSGAKAVTTSTDILLKRLDDLEAERETAKTEKQGWLGKMAAPPEESYEDKRAALIKETGITEESELVKQQNIKVATLQGDLDKIELQRQEEIDRAYDRPTAMANVQAEEDEINRDYDRKKAYKSVEVSAQVAILQAYQGNLKMSYETLDTAIKGWMWDYEESRKRWEIMYDYHSDYLDDLDTDSRRIYDMAYDSAVREEETVKESADYKRGLWADAAQRGVYLDYNKMLNMTSDEVADYYAKEVSEKVEVEDRDITVGSIIGLDKSTAKAFESDLEEEMERAYSGHYGEGYGKGTRELVVRSLQTKYPNLVEEIKEVIYGSDRFNAAFPAGWEKDIQPRWRPREEDEDDMGWLTGDSEAGEKKWWQFWK